jgi:hypothetical protein
MNATSPSAGLNEISSGQHGSKTSVRYSSLPVEIATIAIVGAAILGRFLLARIVNKMLREAAGDLLKR